jgi:hypothetical protein
VDHGSVPFVAGLPAEDIRYTDGRNPAYGALLLYRRAAADLCARRTAPPAVTDLDTATPTCLDTNAVAGANVHTGYHADSNGNPEARGKRHVHVHGHSHADDYTIHHTHTYGYRDANVHSDDDPYRHADRHAHQHADTHTDFYGHAHADALTHTYSDADGDADTDAHAHAESDTERHANTNTDPHTEPGSSAERSIMPMAGEATQKRGPTICRKRDT